MAGSMAEVRVATRAEKMAALKAVSKGEKRECAWAGQSVAWKGLKWVVQRDN
jgi:hypothetical protein